MTASPTGRRRALKAIAALLALRARTALAAGAADPGATSATSGSFADNPIVYFVITDRFANGDPGNDASYGRARDDEQEIGTFHGGDLAGLTQKIKDGWFGELGVNAIWITAPYEQIHGWVVGGNKEFRHYAYHGYYALDYTRLDRNMGTEDDLRALVAVAHARRIRILFDVVMNHPGYATLQDLAEEQVDVLWDGWRKATPQDYHGFIDYNSRKWLDWWGRDWIRAGLRGYDEGGSDDLTRQLAYLPDFKTESPSPVDLPPLLRRKADSGARPIANATVRDYLVAWLTRWVRDFGIDGFRCDTVRHVEAASWLALKKAGVAALADWKGLHAATRIDEAPFWMTGEYWGQDIGRSPLYDAGFDNLINFDFQARAAKVVTPRLDPDRLDPLYADYAKHLGRPADYNVLSYLSSHDTQLFDRARIADGATVLMLAPGGVQIFYGDESGRQPGPATPGDRAQATRSDMNWNTVDLALLEHWRKLGRFRARHVAIAKGRHRRLAAAPYTFSRVDGDDRVVVALGVQGVASIPVGDVFADGAHLRDAYGDSGAVVAGSAVRISASAAGVVLLEAVN